MSGLPRSPLEKGVAAFQDSWEEHPRVGDNGYPVTDGMVCRCGAAAERTSADNHERDLERDPVPFRIPPRCGAQLFNARPYGQDAFRRRGAAYPAGYANRLPTR